MILIALPIAVVAVIGIGMLIAYLIKQGKGAKDALSEGRRLQAELEDLVEPDASGAETPAEGDPH